MTTAALLANPHARLMRRRPDLLDRLRGILGPDVPILVPDGLDALERTAADLLARDPEVIALLGGDGTMSRALTALVRARGALPPVAPLGGGTMNTVARCLGAAGSPESLAASLRDHLDGRRALHPVTRHLLVVDDDRMGFLFGNGLFARYIQAYEEGEPGPARAAWVLARATASALVGGAFARHLTAPMQATIEVDGRVVREGRWLVAAAGTVEQVGLGFRAFPGAVQQPGSLHALGIGCSAFALAFQLPRVRRGIGMRHPDIIEEIGTEMMIRGPADQPYNLDGDLGRTGPVTTVRVGPGIPFLVPNPPRALSAASGAASTGS